MPSKGDGPDSATGVGEAGWLVMQAPSLQEQVSVLPQQQSSAQIAAAIAPAKGASSRKIATRLKNRTMSAKGLRELVQK